MTYFFASYSGGKDSTAMVLRLLEEQRPLDEVVFFDTGMEFEATYRVARAMSDECASRGVRFTTLRPDRPLLFDMLVKPVCAGTDREHYGYEWCGGCARWGTSQKTASIARHVAETSQDAVVYVGIAADEAGRAADDPSKSYPLIEWGMTEADCLSFCESRKICWVEDGVDLYEILDRVSCWCCMNKNIRELRNIRRHLPRYWGYLKGLQSRIDRPFRRDGSTIFDLDERFEREDLQLSLF